MRTIEYRAWDLINKSMLSQAEDDFRFIQPLSRKHLLPSNTSLHIMQFSGLYDKNNKKIFEGDYIKTERGSILEVYFDRGCFLAKGMDSSHFKPIDDWLNAFSEWSEVIGNTYENRQLFPATNIVNFSN
jgi:uncharacterized phage protein (TIGR01671 family)